MQAWSDINTTDPQSGTFTLGGADFPAGTGQVYQILWCPTARPAEESGGTKGSAIDKAVRTNTNCYMRGLKERIEIKTNSSLSWQWRRICFTMKGDTINLGNNDPDTSEVARQTVNGMMRLMTIDNTTLSRANDVVFKGENAVDWLNHFIAPVDTRKVSLKYDRTRVIRSGNDAGVIQMYKQWMPMNKNIYYEDEESGDQTNPSMFSVENKQGMGDYYIYDIFYPNGGTSTDSLAVDIEARLYWHEK